MDAGKPDDGYRKLQQIAGRLRNGEKVGAVTVRELLDWFGAKRRGANITFTIDEALGVNELRTEPYFYQQYIDSPIEFQLTEPIASNDLADNTDALSADTDQGCSRAVDPHVQRRSDFSYWQASVCQSRTDLRFPKSKHYRGDYDHAREGFLPAAGYGW